MSGRLGVPRTPRTPAGYVALCTTVALVVSLSSFGVALASDPPGSPPPDAATGDPGSPIPPEESLEGLPIVRVVVHRYDIFDTTRPETSSWPYRAANALHIVSRARFIRSMLLFAEGDPYSESRVAESARILRSLGFINPVYITARPVEGGVEVTVETHDQWTLEVGGEFGLSGSRTKTGLSFREQNFLGWGREVGVEWLSDTERTSWTYHFEDPNLFGTRWRALLTHADRSDGYLDRVRVEYPFYSLATARAWGVEWGRVKGREHLYSESEEQVVGQVESDGAKLWGGIRVPGGRADVTRRIRIGYVTETTEFSDWESLTPGYPTPADRDIGGIAVGYEQIADRYQVLRGFRAWTRQEDLAMGPNFRLDAVYSAPGLGGDFERILLDGKVALSAVRGGWVRLASAWVSGRFDLGEPRNWRYGLQLATSQLGNRGWQARLLVEDTYRLDFEHQLTLGADVGLRGWQPDFFDGTGRAVANLQWRSIIKEDILHLFSLGFVVFVDSGYTWKPRVGRATERVHFDVGVGLLADFTHIGLANLLRIDVGLPDDGSGYTISVTTSQIF